ncbi:unnamed protein product [Aphanomyces euteiches]
MTPSAPWTRHYRSLLVFGSFVCAIVVMYADVTEAIVTLQVLYGVHATEKGGSYYYAPTIPRFIHMNILNQTRKLHELQDQRVLYTTASAFCYQASDTLYNGSYALPLVQRILDGLNTSINLSATPMTHSLLADCDYSGRHFQDTTVFKIFLVDSSLTLMWSIAVQTMAAMRETTRLEAAVGVAIVSQAEFAKFGVGPDDPPLAFVGDGFWSLQEWALSAGYNRYHLLPMFIVKDNIRSDFLMLFLVWTDVVASTLRVGIWPAIPVVVYMVCYAYSDTLVVSLTSSAVDQETSDYCLQGFLQNIVAYSMTGMNKWDQCC